MARIDLLNAFTSEPPAPDFVLPGLLASTVGMLCGAGGNGKSTFLTEASMAVACGVEGGDILGLRPQKTGRVVYFNAEDPTTEIVRRVHSLGKHLTPAAQSSIAEALEIESIIGTRMNIVDKNSLEAIIEHTKGARLIVFDTLSRIHTLDENSAGDMGKLMGALEHLATETGASVVFAHHVSKGAVRDGQQDKGHASRGSSLLSDNARWAATLSRMSDEEIRKYRGISEGEHPADHSHYRRYVRLSLPKANYINEMPDLWFERAEGGVLVPAKLERTRRGSTRNDASPKHPRSAARYMGANLDW